MASQSDAAALLEHVLNDLEPDSIATDRPLSRPEHGPQLESRIR